MIATRRSAEKTPIADLSSGLLCLLMAAQTGIRPHCLSQAHQAKTLVMAIMHEGWATSVWAEMRQNRKLALRPEADTQIAAGGTLASDPFKLANASNCTNESARSSASLAIDGRRRTGAFLLKGPTNFREMTLELCGKRADQIYRLVGSGADMSIVQHSHLIGEVVRGTLRALTVQPGRTRYFCVINGQTTYRILKAYGRLPKPA